MPAIKTDPFPNNPSPGGPRYGTGPQGPWSQYGMSSDQFTNQYDQNDALTAWYAAAHKNALQDAWNAYHPQGAQPAQATPAGGAPGSGGGGGGGGPFTATPMDQFGAAIAHVNQQYDSQLSNLDRLTGSAKAGTQNVGNETLSRLSALGKDAQKQNKISNKNVRNEFASAKGQQGAAYAALLADLVRQGAQTQGLGSEEAARMSALAGAGARQTAQSDRYSQLLSQSLNERTGLAKQSTQNTMDDLTKALQAATVVAQQRKADQLYQIEQARAQAIAQENAARAAFRRSGGGGGSGKDTGLTGADARGWYDFTHPDGRYDPIDVNSMLARSGLNTVDYKGNEADVVNGYVNDIVSGKITPEAAIINYNARRGEFDDRGKDAWNKGQGNNLGALLNNIQREVASRKAADRRNSANVAGRQQYAKNYFG